MISIKGFFKNILTETAVSKRYLTGTPYNIKVSVIASLLFFIVQLIGISHHEPWMDEFQAFQIAARSHSIGNLLYNMRYEGHPALWHIILYFVTRFTDNVLGMQIVHITIATAGIFILFRYAPFSIIEKILISLGYFIFYEYAQISRCYVLTVFSVMAICALLGETYYKKKLKGQPVFSRSSLLLMALLLSFLANSTVYGLFISGVFTLYFVGIIFNERKIISDNTSVRNNLAISIFIVLLGWTLSFLEIIPLPDNTFSDFIPMGFDLSRTGTVITQLILAYIPIPLLGRIDCWCSYFILPNPNDTLVIPSLIIFIAIGLIFIKKPSIFIFYCLATLGICGLLMYVHNLSTHYFGHLFIVLFACFWLERYISPNPLILKFLSEAIINTFKKIIFIIIITAQAFAGIYMYSMDYIYTFANCKPAGDYITENHLDRFPIVGGSDFIIFPISYYTNKPVITFEHDDTCRFVVWDGSRANNLQPSDFFKKVIEQSDKNNGDTIVVCFSVKPYMVENGAVTSIAVEGTEWALDNSHIIKCIKNIDTPCMIASYDSYYIFLVYKKNY